MYFTIIPELTCLAPGQEVRGGGGGGGGKGPRSSAFFFCKVHVKKNDKRGKEVEGI